ncbi:uncharacterized protein [Cebidichthys violaceus]|uniref:uncharacterized protein isoform X2 n=1 Tax=Cebidichthys violaceus TaxID=271503 RepID=UPI0035CA9E35
MKQTGPCPFRDCRFKSNVHSTYNSHKCREHQNASDYDVSVVVPNQSSHLNISFQFQSKRRAPHPAVSNSLSYLHAQSTWTKQYNYSFPFTVVQMATPDVLNLRVILDEVNAENLNLHSRPETVNALILELEKNLDLNYDFRLQFQDPEFDNVLCNLVNIEDLPSIATVTVVKIIELDLSSASTDDTVLLSDNTESPERLCRWPEVFVVPTFSYEVEFALREGNCAFEKVNAGKCSSSNLEGASPRANIKRPRRGEVQFLHNYPRGENKDTLETRRMEMLEEFKKMPTDRDMVLVHQHMQCTFPLRREEIVTLAPPIAELKDRWPALFSEAQLYGEFHRITNQSLQYSFFTVLDKNTPQLLKLYKERKTGAFGEKMADLLMAYDEQLKTSLCVKGQE